MPDLLDVEWFASHTGDSESLAFIAEAAEMQREALADNIMPIDDTVWKLKLDDRDIYLERSCAVNGLEIYQEIFRDSDHSVVEGFTPSSGQVIVDLGANLGFYAMFAKECASDCSYFGVEANPYIYKLLEQNLCAYSDITLLNAAAGEADGRDEFELVRQLPSIGGATLRQIERKWLDNSIIKKVEIDFMTLDSIYKYFDLSHIDLLKIDIEGYEGGMLEKTPDSVLQQAVRIVLETHTPQIKQQVLGRLETAGYSMIKEDNNLNNINLSNLYFQRDGS